MKHGNLLSNDNRKRTNHRKMRLKKRDVLGRDGVTCSSEEVSVMEMERRGGIIQLEFENN